MALSRHQDSKYVAVKAITAEVDAADLMELDLEKLDRTAQCAGLIVGMHHFILKGPNEPASAWYSHSSAPASLLASRLKWTTMCRQATGISPQQ